MVMNSEESKIDRILCLTSTTCPTTKKITSSSHWHERDAWRDDNYLVVSKLKEVLASTSQSLYYCAWPPSTYKRKQGPKTFQYAFQILWELKTSISWGENQHHVSWKPASWELKPALCELKTCNWWPIKHIQVGN